MSAEKVDAPAPIERIRYRDLLDSVAEKLDMERKDVAPIADVFLDEFIDIFVNGNLLKCGDRGTFKTKSRNEWVINIKYARPNLTD